MTLFRTHVIRVPASACSPEADFSCCLRRAEGSFNKASESAIPVQRTGCAVNRNREPWSACKLVQKVFAGAYYMKIWRNAIHFKGGQIKK